MITIIVGDATQELVDFAHTVNIQSKSLTNLDSTSLTEGTYYLSLRKCNDYANFVEFLEYADKIIYHPPTHWADTDSNGHSCLKEQTEIGLTYFYNDKPIINFELSYNYPDSIKFLSDVRKTDSPQIWIAGTSNSQGLGLNREERYGQILADYYKRDVSFLTSANASINWVTDQVLRSDIRPKDLVVFSTSPIWRYTLYENQQVRHISVNTYRKDKNLNDLISVDFLDHEHLTLYSQITCIEQVVNFCNKAGAYVIIAGLFPTLVEYCTTHKNYVNLYHKLTTEGRKGKFMASQFDLAKDGIHPGPKTHQWYANKIIQRIQQLNFQM